MEILLGSTNYGFLALMPAVVAIILALRTKNVYVSLALGLYSGVVMLDIFNVIILDASLWIIPVSFLAAIVQIPIYLTNTLGDPWDAGIVLQCLFIGGIIYLISYTGGSTAIANFIARFAKNRKSSQFFTWVMGIIIFFDDYANSLIVGPIMRPMIDRMNISREKFAFIIDATAAPIAGIAIISTWIGYELSLIQQGMAGIGITTSPFIIFFNSIPFRFYNILMLAFILLTIYTKREFGPMLKAEQLAIRGEDTPGKLVDSDIKGDQLKIKKDIKSNLWDGFLPLGTLIFGSLIFFYINGYFLIVTGDPSQIDGLEAMKQALQTSPLSFGSIQLTFSNANAAIVLFQAAILTLMVIFIRGKIKKQFNLNEGIEVFIGGANSMLSTIFILMFAWSLGSIISALGASDYVVTLLGDAIPAFLLPAIVFILAGFIAFSTGTSYGTMGIMMPIVIPLSYAIFPDMGYITLSIAGVLTGATFGDHCSPISDTTILSSMGAGCDHIEHVSTQMPYAVVVGAVSIVAYILAPLAIQGIGGNVNIGVFYLIAFGILVLGVICLYIILKIIGTKLEYPKNSEVAN